LNATTNKPLRTCPGAEASPLLPPSHDGGTPVGGEILGYLDLCGERNKPFDYQPPRDMYLGLDFSDDEMESAIKESGMPYIRMDQPAKHIAKLLSQKQIIGRFNGREEVGPRALGNRTIMADPRDLINIRKLNFAIKYRDFWMPFAASILEEDATRYIKNLKGWPYYMIEAFDTQPCAEKEIIAGMHPMDLTVRPQLVNELNPGY